MNDEKRMQSKLFIFFEWLYRLLVMNVLMIVPALPLVTYLRFIKNPNIILIIIFIVIIFVFFFPGLVATYATIKEGIDVDNLFKVYFRNYKKYLVKSLIMGLIIFISLAIIIFGLLFYIFQDFKGSLDKQAIIDIIGEKASSVGVVIMAVTLIFALLMIVNVPLLMIYFNKLTSKELIKSSFYLAFRYFLTSFILLIILLVSIISGILSFFSQNAALLLGWMLIGMALPIFLSVKLSRTIYFILNKKQFERIMHYDEEDDLSDLDI